MSIDAAFESLAEREIRLAHERGEFDGLAGAGAPIEGLGGAYDPDWWAKRFVEREKARGAADHLRRKIRAELPGLRTTAPSEVTLQRVEGINAMIAAVNEMLPAEDRLKPITL